MMGPLILRHIYSIHEWVVNIQNSRSLHWQNALKYAQKQRMKVVRKCLLDAHAHQFRHGKASHWLEDGINVVQVSFLLGHKQLETTMRYLDITTEDKIKALATLEDENQKAVPKKWKNKNGTLTDFCGLKK